MEPKKAKYWVNKFEREWWKNDPITNSDWRRCKNEAKLQYNSAFSLKDD
jgi:hypothetical protein